MIEDIAKPSSLPRSTRGDKAPSHRVVRQGTQGKGQSLPCPVPLPTLDQVLVSGWGCQSPGRSSKYGIWGDTGVDSGLLEIPKGVNNPLLPETSYWPSCVSPPVPQVRSKHMCQQHIFFPQAVLTCASDSLTTFQKRAQGEGMTENHPIWEECQHHKRRTPKIQRKNILKVTA